MPHRIFKMDPTDKLLLRNQLCCMTYLLTHKMVKLYTPVFNRLKLTYPQFLVMSILWENNGMLVTEIGKILRLETGSLTPLLQRLEKLGFLARHSVPEDKRKVEIRLTSKGLKLYHQASEEIPALSEFASTVGCTSEYVTNLRNSMVDLLNRLDQLPGQNYVEL